MISKSIGFLILVATLALVHRFETVPSAHGALAIFHWPALLLTGLGPVGLLLLCSEWETVHSAIRVQRRRSPAAARREREQDAELLRRLAPLYYRDGARAFEGLRASARTRSLQKALGRLSLRLPLADVREAVLREKEETLLRFERWQELLGTAVRLTPSVGMLGTILGMVRLLSTLQDPGSIGSPMSLALLTTFYGLFFSLALWTPLQKRILGIGEEELAAHESVRRWLESIEARKAVELLGEAPGPGAEA